MSPLSLRRAGRPASSGERCGLAVVTGTSSGIGRATAVALAQRGYRVIAGVRRPEDATSIAAEHGRIEPFFLDVTNAEHRSALQERLDREPDGLQLLVNNAGVVGGGPIEVMPIERWQEVIGINVVGTIAITQAALPALFRARGRVVNVSSPSGQIAFPMLGSYSVSKFALQGFTDTLRREAAPGGVTVTSVSPGLIRTEIFGKGLEEGRELMGRVYPPELHARYGELASGAIVAGEDAITGGGASPESAAALIVRAATARRPRTRYYQGIENRAVRILAALPDRVTDRLIAQATRSEYATPAAVLEGRSAPGNLPPSKRFEQPVGSHAPQP
jgi:NAD(P)-dependent dehydrogenase (short-subunit alcohol dehydrogenase family)